MSWDAKLRRSVSKGIWTQYHVTIRAGAASLPQSELNPSAVCCRHKTMHRARAVYTLEFTSKVVRICKDGPALCRPANKYRLRNCPTSHGAAALPSRHFAISPFVFMGLWFTAFFLNNPSLFYSNPFSEHSLLMLKRWNNKCFPQVRRMGSVDCQWSLSVFRSLSDCLPFLLLFITV